MALSAKERQARYREKRKAERGYRLDMIVSLETDANLELLSLHGNMTKKQLIEKLVKDEFVRRVNQDNTFSKFIDEQSRADIDTPILPQIEPSDVAKTVTDTNPPPKAKTSPMPPDEDLEMVKCDKTLDMFPDNDWRLNGLNDEQIAKIKNHCFEFDQLNQHIKYNVKPIIEKMQIWETELKDPKTLTKYKGIDEILSK